MSYLRHPNGKGKIFGDSEVCVESVLDRSSSVSGDSHVWTSRLTKNTQIRDSDVHLANIEDSIVQGSEIVHATIINSQFTAEIATYNARIINSVIGGSSKIGHDAVIDRCNFNNLTVRGSANLVNWPDEMIDGQRGYIQRGVWRRPPRIYRTSFNVTLTESVFDKELYAFVACREFPISRWLKVGDRYGKAQGWSPEQVQEVREIFLEWQSG